MCCNIAIQMSVVVTRENERVLTMLKYVRTRRSFACSEASQANGSCATFTWLYAGLQWHIANEITILRLDLGNLLVSPGYFHLFVEQIPATQDVSLADTICNSSNFRSRFARGTHMRTEQIAETETPASSSAAFPPPETTKNQKTPKDIAVPCFPFDRCP